MSLCLFRKFLPWAADPRSEHCCCWRDPPPARLTVQRLDERFRTNSHELRWRDPIQEGQGACCAAARQALQRSAAMTAKTSTQTNGTTHHRKLLTHQPHLLHQPHPLQRLDSFALFTPFHRGQEICSQ